MAAPPPAPFRPAQKSPLDRALSIVTDVRAGEGLTALLLTANLFTFFALYYLLRPVRQALILSEATAVAASYSAAAQALILAGVVPLYGVIASRVNRMTLITWVICFFAANLGIFYLLGSAGARLGVPFYIWLGIFNLMIPAQLWAFANDIYVSERGKRLFPLIGIGASLGAWIGAEIASSIFDLFGQPYPLMLIAGMSLFICLGLTVWANRREEQASSLEPTAAHAEKPLGPEGGFQLVLAQRYLLYIALFIVMLNIVSTIGDFLLADLVERRADALVADGTIAADGVGAWIGGFYGDFYANVNLAGFLIQTFLVSRIMKYLGVRGALFVVPLVALGTYGGMLFFPVFTLIRWVKVLENGTNYSLLNTVRHALFLPTSREAKYKAKQAIDAFFWRAGDLLQAVVVFIGTRIGMETSQYAALNLVFVVIWLGLAVGIAREHRRITGHDIEERAA